MHNGPLSPSLYFRGVIYPVLRPAGLLHLCICRPLPQLEAKAAALKGEGASAEEASSSLASYGESLKSIDSLLHVRQRPRRRHALPLAGVACPPLPPPPPPDCSLNAHSPSPGARAGAP